MGIVDRLMRSSVDRALKMQPRKVQRVADETRYASPQERPRVDDMRGAGIRVAHAQFAVADLGAVAVRRELGGMTVTEPDADLGHIDGRELVTWIPGDPETSAGDAMDARNSLLFAALSSDDDAVGAVLAHPPFLLAAAAGALLPIEALDALGAAAGPIDRAPVRGLGVWLVGDGVIAVGTSAVNAAARLEAGERLAQIALIVRKDGHG